jgi:drug/metabolite transporter (DMT)-like permease
VADHSVSAAREASGHPRSAFLYLAIIILSWAVNWPLMRLALADVRPLVFIALRMIGSIAVLALMLGCTRQPMLALRHERRALFWVGQFQVTGFILFAIIGLSIVPPGRAIVLAYTMPLWAVPLGRWLMRERLSRMKLLGAAIGFAGLLLFMNPGLVDWSDPRAAAGNACLVLAAICWAAGSCLYRRRLWLSSFWSQTFEQLLGGAVAVILVALAAEPDWTVHWTPALVAILAYNWVVTTVLGYFLWNKVLTAMSPAIAGQALTLTPIGGFLLSTAIFGGAVTGEVIASIALIILGLVLTLSPR